MSARLLTVAAMVVTLLITATSAGAHNNDLVSGPSAPSVAHGQTAVRASSASGSSTARKRAIARKRAAAKRQAAKRRAERKKLLRAAQRDPQVISSASYVRKAAALGFELPMSFRFQRVLNDDPLEFQPPNDMLQVDPSNGSVAPVPFLGVGTLAGPQTTTLTGVVRLYAIFTDPRIADTPGTMRLRISEIDLESSPVVLATKECTPGVVTDFLKTGPIDLSMNPTYESLGVTNLFTGGFEVTFNVSLAFNSYRDDDCDGIFDVTKRAVTPNGGSQRPVSLRMVGQSQVSPGITRDGATRLLLADVDNSVIAQPAFDQVVNTCTSAPELPTGTCAPGDGDNQTILTRFKTLNLSVEALIGH